MLHKFKYIPLTLILLLLSISLSIQAEGDFGRKKHKDHHGKMSSKHHFDLNTEQRGMINEMVEEMRQSGANRNEIKQSVDQMLTDFGVEQATPFKSFFDQLSQEQKLQIDTKVQDLAETDVSQKEIRQQVKSMLTDFGIDVPSKAGKKCKLSPEQKKHAEKLMKDGLEETEVQDALVDLAIIDAIIAAAPQPKNIIRLKLTTMGHIKLNHSS